MIALASAPWVSPAIWIIARVCLVAMFPFSAIDKVWHWKNSLDQTKKSGLPGGVAMLVLAIAVEGLTPLMVIFGVWDRLGAFLLAGFCVATAFLYHPFWAYKDFWSQRDDSVAREHFWQFTKNFCIVGGLMLVMFAGSLKPAAAVLAHPLSSSVRGG